MSDYSVNPTQRMSNCPICHKPECASDNSTSSYNAGRMAYNVEFMDGVFCVIFRRRDDKEQVGQMNCMSSYDLRSRRNEDHWIPLKPNPTDGKRLHVKAIDNAVSVVIERPDTDLGVSIRLGSTNLHESDRWNVAMYFKASTEDDWVRLKTELNGVFKPNIGIQIQSKGKALCGEYILAELNPSI
jgi:hypothetical protein